MKARLSFLCGTIASTILSSGTSWGTQEQDNLTCREINFTANTQSLLKWTETLQSSRFQPTLCMSQGIDSLAAFYLAQASTEQTTMIDGRLDSNSEKLEGDNYYKFHTLRGKAGEQFTIELTSRDFEPFLILIDSNGNTIAHTDSNGRNARLTVILPKDGVLGVGVFSKQTGKTGNYTLNIRPATAEDLELAESDKLNQQANQLYQKGQYNQAISLAQKALAIREKILDKDHLDIAESLNNLAELYREQGNYVDAEPLYQRALAIFEKTLGQNHSLVAKSLSNLALLYRFQGNYVDAESLYKRSLAIFEKIRDRDHPDIAQILNNLAALYYFQGNYIAAEPLFQRALVIREKTLGTDHFLVAESLNNLASLYQDRGNYTAAESLYQRSLAIYEKVLGKDHPDVALSLRNLALLYRNQGNYVVAEPLYQRSLAIYEKTLGKDHPDVADSLNNLATLYQIKGDIPQSLTYLNRSTDIEEHNLALMFTTGSERQKQAYMSLLTGTTDQTISLHLQDAPNNPQAARLALTTLLRRKGRILEAQTQILQAIRDNLTPENQQLLDELQSASSQLSNLLYRGAGDTPIEQYKQQISTLKTQVEQLEAQLSRNSAQFRTATEPVTIEAVRKLIPTNAILVEFVLYYPFNFKENKGGKPHYAAYLLNSQGDIQWVDLGEAEPINQAITAFLLDLQDNTATSNVKPVARRLDALLMQPLRQKLGNTRHILISPDSNLNLIPFAALVGENNRYLVENYTFTYLSTGRDLLSLANSYPSQQSPVILANPDFDNPGQTVQVAQTQQRSTDNQRSNDLTSLQFGSLPGTKAEAEFTAQILPNVKLFTQSQATENVLKQLNAPSILHLATHGFFLTDIPLVAAPDFMNNFSDRGGLKVVPIYQNPENPLLRSGLALAGFNQRESGTEDGVLTAFEATGLNLRGTKLVVLSACETGIGDVNNGEGVYGLRRAFVMAGAESQLFSLWQVDDYGTKDLMVNYYRRVVQQNEPRSEALRQVQLEMLHGQNYQHPYYWSAFLFSGDWRTMRK